MKKLTLLLILGMLPMLAFGQTDSLTAPSEGTTQMFVTNGCVGLTPDSRDYGNQAVDFATGSRLFIFSNGCAVNLNITNINATGGSFSQSNDCSGILPPNHSCDIRVVFDPNSAGLKSQNLVITYLKQGNPTIMHISAGLTGTGIHDLTFTPTSCDFFVIVGNEGYCTVRLQNEEPVRLTLHCQISGEFSQDTACPASLAPYGDAGDSVNIILDFGPEQAGTYTGQFTVTTNSPEEQQSGNPYIVPLFGVARQICSPPMCCNGQGPCPPPSN